MAKEGKTPEWLARKPELLPGVSLYLLAYSRLSTERPYGQIPGPIPWSKIVEYADRLGHDDPEYFGEVISRIDSWELREIGKSLKIGQPKSSRTPSKIRT
ncbi:hypothetical protein [Caudoviricetes sp.]|nr:hypothetical protein [Caudoviricetes sp.]